MRLLLISILSLLLSSCSNKEDIPVEVLGAMRGKFVDSVDGKKKFVETDAINISLGEGAVWYAYLRTNKEKIRYVEEIKLNGSTKWNVESDGQSKDSDTISFAVSDDKTTAIVTRNVENRNGFLIGTWSMYEDEPTGPMTVKVTIEGKSIVTFNWELKKN